MSRLELHTPILYYDSRERFLAQSVDGRPDVIYGREVDGWLQYWIWYTENYSRCKGRHEGDWEMVQVRPGTDAAYARHADGQRRPWGAVRASEGRPHVYVASGTHASYFEPGWHRRTAVSLERANGRVQCHPTLELLPETGWPLSPRRWGRDPNSPRSPGAHMQWRRPTQWASRFVM